MTHTIMKRLFIFLYCCTFIVISISAQTTKYFIGNFYVLQNGDNPFKRNGIHRYDKKSDIFFFTNTTIGYSIELNHFDHRNPEVLDIPISELEDFDDIIWAEELLKFESADDAYRWMLEILKSEAKLYIIDSNKFYKSDETLPKSDMMKVLEVHISYEDLPDHIVSSL